MHNLYLIYPLPFQDLNKYGFNTLEDIAALKRGEDVKTLKSPEIKWGYESYRDLVTRAVQSGDKPLLGKIKVNDRYSHATVVCVVITL